MVKKQLYSENSKQIVEDEKNKSNSNPKIKEISTLSRKERRRERNVNYSNTKKSNKGFHKLNNEEILEKYNFNFSRDAEWYKKTNDKINEVKDDLDKKFYNPEKKKEKIDFIRKLKNKLKDYRDAINFAEKYKKVRFVERRKLERMLKKFNKEIKIFEDKIKNEIEIDPNKSILDEKIKMNDAIMKRDKIIMDINYVKFFPKSYKYLSLFPKNDTDNDETKMKIEKIRKKINFHLNKTSKTKKLMEKKLSSLQENQHDLKEIEKNEENNEKVSNIEHDNKVTKENKEKISQIKSKENKDKQNKKKREMIGNLDYEDEVINNNGLENDDFFIIE